MFRIVSVNKTRLQYIYTICCNGEEIGTKNKRANTANSFSINDFHFVFLLQPEIAGTEHYTEIFFYFIKNL